MASIVEFSLDPRFASGAQFVASNSEFNRRLGDWHRMYRFESNEVPKTAQLSTDRKTISDFCPINGCMSMCREAKDIVETIEPGVHQFFPVEIVRKRSKKPIYRLDGRVLDEPYLFFHCQTWLDAVVIEQSNVYLRSQHGEASPRVYTRLLDRPKYNIVLREEAVQGHHIWRGDRQLNSQTFFSDQLVAAINKAKLRQLVFYHLKEI